MDRLIVQKNARKSIFLLFVCMNCCKIEASVTPAIPVLKFDTVSSQIVSFGNGSGDGSNPPAIKRGMPQPMSTTDNLSSLDSLGEAETPTCNRDVTSRERSAEVLKSHKECLQITRKQIENTLIRLEVLFVHEEASRSFIEKRSIQILAEAMKNMVLKPLISRFLACLGGLSIKPESESKLLDRCSAMLPD